MKDTCRLECRFYKDRERKCPNFMRSMWLNDKGETIVVEDCAPIRTTLMIQDLTRRVLALQKVAEEGRNFTLTVAAPELLKRIEEEIVNVNLT